MKIIVFFGLMSVSLFLKAVEFPQLPSLRECKPLIDKNLKINVPPIRNFSSKVSKKLIVEREFMTIEEFEETISMLIAMEEKSNNNYDKAVINRNLGYAYVQAGQMNEALGYFDKALAYGHNNLPHEVLQNLRTNVAALFYSNDNKNKALFIMEEWMKNSNKDDANAYYLLAAIYADSEIDRIKDALCPAYFAIKSLEKPKESYYELLLSIHYELEDYVGSANVLEVMVQTFPQNIKFKKQLATIYEKIEP
ncbi:MAG: hypothetical protein OEY19_08485 [Gammaproteobacteria bacterium]|nr:hypothetical protein [Gammaproteobacteria bacterium]MDH5630941.1 hypothetical protein [Gammaproteobacteria bacterium]